MRNTLPRLSSMPLCTASLIAGVTAASGERWLTFIQGNPEDFIPVDGAPLTDMSDIRNATLTVKDGTIFRPAETHPAIGVGQ